MWPELVLADPALEALTTLGWAVWSIVVAAVVTVATMVIAGDVEGL